EKSLQHVAVTMCAGDTPNCATVVDGPVSTDANGQATLVDSTATAYYLGLNGYLYLQSPDVRPTMAYWGFPLVVINGVLSDPIPVFTTTDANPISNPTLGAIA